MKRRRRPEQDSSPTGEWSAWVADNMQQRERGLSPQDDSTPSALILLPLLGLPAVLIVGLVVAFLLK